MSREQDLSDFVEEVPIGLHWLGPDGIILWANRAELQMLGYQRVEYVGHHIADFYVDRSSLDDATRPLPKRDTWLEHETSLRCKDGSIRQVIISCIARRESGELRRTECWMRDITGAKQAQEEQLHAAAIIESSDDAIISKTLEGTITSWNAAAERLYGYTAAEAIGQPINILIPEGHEDEEPRIIERLRRGERIEHYETVRVTKDGRFVEVSLTISPVRNAAGRIIGASKIARDITERKKAEAERTRLLAAERSSREAAEFANRSKDEFLATVSHELRTPLTAILGWARLLRGGNLSDSDTARAVMTIEHNARVQVQLIEDLLDISRIVAGKLRLDLRPVEPVQVIDAALDSIRPAAEAKGIRLERILDPRAGPVSGDADRLQQVVWNLLSNAVKFTPRQGRVQIQLQRVDSHLEIIVSDTGTGIPPEFLPQIFERFQQADKSATRKFGGLGLGLAIVRHLVELHGGTVSARSDGEGQGATFIVTLPTVIMRHAPQPREGAHPTAGSEIPFEYPPVLRGLKVLVVDDEASTLELLVAILERCGAEVRTAGSTREALQAIREAPPEVLITDIGMPGEDGYALLRQARQLQTREAQTLPAIALTAFARVEDRLRALSAGFRMHVPKPVEPAELVAVVASVAGRTTTA